MKIVRDTPLEVGYLVWQLHPPQPSLTVIVKGTFDLVADGPCALAAEQRPPTGDLFHDDDEEQSPRYESDFAVLKPRGECYLVGVCAVPGGGRATMLRCAFQVGGVRKSFAVLGDRRWRSGLLDTTASEPEPFATMPLRFERSFGGRGFEQNPYGRGIGQIATPAGPVVPLPNLEHLEALVTSPRARPEPVCTFPIPRTWKSRTRWTGSYDKAYQRTRWPWFPEDFRLEYFLGAPEDQRINGFWRGDEEIVLHNLLAERPTFRTRLPGIAPRCFLRERAHHAGAGGAFHEVRLALDTVTVDTEHRQAVCVWRGVVDVPTESLDTFEHLFVSHEPLAARGPAAVHRERYAAVLRAEADEASEAAGGPPPTEDPAPDDAAEAARDATPDPDDADASDADGDELDPLAAVASFPEPPGSPPDAAQVVRSLQAAGVALPPEVVRAVLEPDAPDEPDAAEPTPPRADPTVRERVEARLRAGDTLAGEDLSYGDLSGLVLRETDLSGAILRGALLRGTDLSGARLDEAQLAEAHLEDTDLRGASLVRADLTAARITRSSLAGAALRHAVLDRAQFAGCDLTRSACSYASFVGAHLRGVSMSGGNFDDADFSAASFEQVDLTAASLQRANLEGATAPGLALDGSDLTGLNAAEGARLRGSTLRSVRAAGSIWSGSDLSEANFAFSDLTRADFTGAALVRSRLDGCVARHARFLHAQLVGASALRADLFECDLEGANLSHADLRGANLFGAELWRARADGARLELANVKRTKLAR